MLPDERILTFEGEAGRLCGILAVPAAGKPRAAAVLIHGWGGYRIGAGRGFVEIARSLAEARVASLRFDLRCRGDSAGSAGEEDLDGMISDAERAARILRESTGLERIALLGICSGGNVAIGAGSRGPELSPLALVSTLPFADSSGAAAGRRRRAIAGKLRKLALRETWRKLLRGEIYFDLLWRRVAGAEGSDRAARGRKDSRRNVMADFARYRGRAVFIYGGDDGAAALAREHYGRFCAESSVDSEFVEIPGATHEFSSAQAKRRLAEEVIRILREGDG